MGTSEFRKMSVAGGERRRRVSHDVDHALRVRRSFRFVNHCFVENHTSPVVIPAQAGIQYEPRRRRHDSRPRCRTYSAAHIRWIPAYAGMTIKGAPPYRAL
jgi:hypothetical protein